MTSTEKTKGFARHLLASFALDHHQRVLVVVRCAKGGKGLKTGLGCEPTDALADALQQPIRFACESDEREACVAALLGRDLRFRLDPSRQISLVA